MRAGREASGPDPDPLDTLDAAAPGERFAEAFAYVVELHADQERKGRGTPYVAHLMSAAALVLEHGGGEREAVAALLHDAAEDQGGRERLAAIEERFGAGVARIVDACSDTLEHPKPAWLPRKQRYVAHLERAPLAVRLVAGADKLHNARSVVRDLVNQGPEAVFERFSASKAQTLWYYRALADALAAREPSPIAELVGLLEAVVGRMEALARGRAAGGGREAGPG